MYITHRCIHRVKDDSLQQILHPCGTFEVSEDGLLVHIPEGGESFITKLWTQTFQLLWLILGKSYG
jgi:hypothetical protein